QLLHRARFSDRACVARFLLKRAHAHSWGTRHVSFFEPQAPLPSTEILLVDDDPKTLVAMEAMLADLGASLVTARNGRDALLKLLSRDFAVILLDVQMPEIDGFQTAELIRERDKSRHTPIIFLTAFSQNDR